ncbi:MAG: alpha/beta fold hydrolase [Actinomycetia bacterium]|nr:alpha/beta fold hydrolase [Actinomycetes bacterium]
MHITEQVTMVGDTRIFHREAGAGFPLVLLHGGGGTGKAFWHQLQGLGEQFRVLAPDMPGFGKSDWAPGATTVDDLAPVLWAWADVLGLERLALGGNSMGGRVALAMALSAPARVVRLALLDAVGVSVPGVAPLNPLTVPPAEFVSTMVHDPEHYRQVTPYRTLEDARELNAGRAAFARYLAAAPIGPDRSAELGRLTMPVLLIWGRHDRVVPLPLGEALAERLPHARLVVLEDVGHLPHIEAAGAVNQLLADFLAGV